LENRRGSAESFGYDPQADDGCWHTLLRVSSAWRSQVFLVGMIAAWSPRPLQTIIIPDETVL